MSTWVTSSTLSYLDGDYPVYKGVTADAGDVIASRMLESSIFDCNADFDSVHITGKGPLSDMTVGDGRILRFSRMNFSGRGWKGLKLRPRAILWIDEVNLSEGILSRITARDDTTSIFNNADLSSACLDYSEYDYSGTIIFRNSKLVDSKGWDKVDTSRMAFLNCNLVTRHITFDQFAAAMEIRPDCTLPYSINRADLQKARHGRGTSPARALFGQASKRVNAAFPPHP